MHQTVMMVVAMEKRRMMRTMTKKTLLVAGGIVAVLWRVWRHAIWPYVRFASRRRSRLMLVCFVTWRNLLDHFGLGGDAGTGGFDNIVPTSLRTYHTFE